MSWQRHMGVVDRIDMPTTIELRPGEWQVNSGTLHTDRWYKYLKWEVDNLSNRHIFMDFYMEPNPLYPTPKREFMEFTLGPGKHSGSLYVADGFYWIRLRCPLFVGGQPTDPNCNARATITLFERQEI